MNNTVTTIDVAADALFPIDGIRVEAGAASTDSGVVCAQISGNTATGANSVPAESPGDDIRLRNRFAHTFQLPGLGGAGTSSDAINLLDGANPASGLINATSTTTPNFASAASCPTPP
jgi:hypothetical protein